MTGVIIDDEARSLRTLKALCEEYCPELTIVAEARSVAQARPILAEHEPDLIFLDIQMPIEDGFMLLEDYESELPFEVIFTTAYDQYAFKAFQAQASDYLLKPIEIDELIASVEKVRDRLNIGDNSQQLQCIKNLIDNRFIDKIALTTSDGFTFVEFDHIVRCEAEGNYTKVHFNDNSFLLLTKTLGHYDNILLKRNDFVRAHKSHIINLNYVREFVRGRQSMLELKDGSRVEVSERRKKSVIDILDSF